MKALLDKPCSRRRLLKGTIRLCFNVGLSSILLDNFLGSAACRAATADDQPAADNAHRFEPAYLERHRTGELGRRAEELWALMEACELCPRSCGVNRLEGEEGYCRTPGADLVISAFQPHFGEERPLVGRGGSGTIFLTHCNLRCAFCQNWEISQLGRGAQRSIEDLAQMMLSLQKIGCHNLNFVTPTHYAAHILKALEIAAADGLRLPIVYNTSGRERADIIALLDGIVAI